MKQKFNNPSVLFIYLIIGFNDNQILPKVIKL